MSFENLVAHCSAVDLMRSIDDGVAGAVITDPPERVKEVREVMRQTGRILRPGAAMVIIGTSNNMQPWERLASKVNMSKMAEVIVLWDSGRPRTRNFGALHSRVVWYVKNGWRHTFNFNLKPGQQLFSNVIVCKRVPVEDRVHPSEKPVGLTNFLVSLLTNPNDLVVDPYCGSGSTLVSAVQCGRRYLGADVEADYVRLANKRIGYVHLEIPDSVYLWVNGVQHEI